MATDVFPVGDIWEAKGECVHQLSSTNNTTSLAVMTDMWKCLSFTEQFLCETQDQIFFMCAFVHIIQLQSHNNPKQEVITIVSMSYME